MIQKIEKMNNCDSIPKSLVKYYEKSMQTGEDNSLTLAMNRNPIETIEAIDKMFSMASAFTRKSPTELLDKTGFHLSDMDPSRLDSAFAEIRTINFLGLHGFDSIEIVHSKVKKYADITACRNGKKNMF